ncbi:DNA repair protein RecO [Parasediminibacterium sp. JCM 36343]|uniref:DNA repair protein RecO n=1 Tax=Parasediminibacterium sp. JCM 36343 TaxID=3374279 RepID=UPI00397D1F37
MQLHNTKGIVLRTVKYGDTSIITTIYTELFGVQSYIVKGARQAAKGKQGKAVYFQAATILDMAVYHNEQKHLQFIKEYHLAYPYQAIQADVVKNCVSMYIVEVLQHTLKQPEANPDLFYLIENTLQQVDKGSNALTANLPLYFMLHLGNQLGFQVQGNYSLATPYLDLAEGFFVPETPNHAYYLTDELAMLTSQINNIVYYTDLENIKLNRQVRIQLLEAYGQYLSLHITDFGILKTLPVLHEILG